MSDALFSELDHIHIQVVTTGQDVSLPVLFNNFHDIQLIHLYTECELRHYEPIDLAFGGKGPKTLGGLLNKVARNLVHPKYCV